MPAKGKLKAVPAGYHTVTPYFTVKGAAKLIDFLKKAFDAEERFRMPGPNGTVAHAELKIGDSMVMIGDAGEQWPVKTGQVYLYLEDCDRFYKQVLAAGATFVPAPADQVSGERNG